MEIVILILSAGLGGIHLWRIFYMARCIRSQESNTSDQVPRISVVVCAHNESENLTALVPLLVAQHYPHFEVIIALDRCTDESESWLKSMNAENLKILSLTEVPNSHHPKKWAIEQSIASAAGEWILLTDADCRPDPQWIASMARNMASDKEIVLGYSPYFEEKSFLNRLIQWETTLTALNYLSSATKGRAYMGVGRNLAYRKAIFKGFGNIQHTTGGDDDLLVQQLANKENVGICLDKEGHVPSIPKRHWQAYIKQKTRHFGVSKYYQPTVKWRETLRWGLHLAFWVSLVLAIVVSPIIGLVILGLVYVMMAISINIVADRLQKRFNPLVLPFVDALYVVMMPLISLRSSLVKRITWK